MLKHRLALPDHEEVFLQRYQRLRLSALQLVQNDQQLAEDLLHDVFLQFTVIRPNLKAIENLDGYLYRMLRNMHLSHLRRTSRMREATRPLLDYDSATAGLETLRHQTESQARDELRRICEYALLRKHTSKAASLLILRFFHGYYPTEIAQVLHKSRNVVDVALRTVRAEAKAYLADPDSLSFINERTKSETPALDPSKESGKEPGEESGDVLIDLRRLIFHSPAGDCLTHDDLMAVFQAKGADGPDCTTLAHIVCCETCLDAVNTTLGLPLIATRHPEKVLLREKRSDKKSDGGDPPQGGGGTGDGEMERFVKGHRRRKKELLEHHPKELRISVNGFIVGAHTVNSELSKQALSVNLEERISFVEVFSERDVRLLFCGIEPPPDGPGAYHEQVRLSEGRTLDLNLDFADSRPQINVTYLDPNYRAVPVAAAEDATIYRKADETSALLLSESVAKESRPRKLLKRSSERLGSLLKSLRPGLFSSGFWWRPATITGFFAILLVGALALLYWRVPAPPVTAASLLQKASAAEETDAARTDQIVHRTMNLEEKTATGELIKRQRLEVWQNAEKRITARRLYDDRGTLVAGDWRRGDGVQTLYHHGSNPRFQIGNPQSAIRNFEDVWQLSPSAKEFSALIGPTQSASVEESGNAYVISSESAESVKSADGFARLIKATLVLSRIDLHATEQMLIIQQGNELRVFHFAEASFERHAPSTVAPSVFDPEPALLGTDTGIRRNGDTENITASPSLPVTVSPVVATAELEVEVLRLLNQVGADFGEQLSVTHTPQGTLRVEGVVETDKRKKEILAALAPVKSNPAVRVELQTVVTRP